MLSYHIISFYVILYYILALYYIISYHIIYYYIDYTILNLKTYISIISIYIYIYIHTDRGFAPLLIWVSPSTPVSQLQQAIMSLVKASNGIMGMYIVGLRQLGFGMMTFPI